jgi:hypothetical protein
MINTQRFYPSPSTVTYFINDVWIDDMFRVDFQRKVNYQPIWGYDSRKFDFIAKGKEIVTGNLIINYRYPGYLRAAIKNSNNSNDALRLIVQREIENRQDSAIGDTFLQEIDSQTIEQKSRLLSNKIISANRTLFNEYGNVATQSINRSGRIDARTFRNQSLINDLKSKLRSYYGSESEEEQISDFSSPLDENEIMTFDLTMSYGFEGRGQTYSRIIKDCVLIGESETVSASAGISDDMSSSAQPILEVYSFFARTIEVKQG